MKNILLIILVLSITACASSRGFDRGSLRDQTSNQKSVTEEDIKKVLTLKPQLPNPFKLAVFFSSYNTMKYYRNDWTWVGEDKDKFLLINDSLGDKNIISDVILISDSIVEGKDSKAIRLAAARAGADAVLIVNGISDVDKYNNSLGFTYILLITPFFIPGTELDALFIANATMWDVRNQYLYLSIEAEGMANQTRPEFFIEERRVINQAKVKAIDILKAELLSRLLSMGRK